MALITVEEMWEMQWKRQTIGTLKEKRCHSETMEVSLMKIVFREFDLVRFNVSSLLVLYAQI